MSEKKYNGWTNRETWLVNLWLTNDQNIYNLIIETFKHLKHTYQMRDFVDDLLFGMNPIAENGLMLDLLNSAIANLNIFEIVEFFRETNPNESLIVRKLAEMLIVMIAPTLNKQYLEELKKTIETIIR